MDDITTKYGIDEKIKNQSSADTSFQKDMSDVKDSLSKSAQHISDKAGDMLNDMKDQTADIHQAVMTYVKANPVKSVGFALLAGFLAALIVRK